MLRATAFWLGICVACAGATARAATGSRPTSTRFHSEEYGFSAQIPAGYVEAPDAVVQQIQHQLDLLKVEGKIEVVGVYVRGVDGTAPVSGIQIQGMHHPKGRQFTRREMQQFIAEATGVDEHKIRKAMRGNADLGFRDLKVGEVSFDDENKCLSYSARMTVANFGDMRMRSVNYFGHEGVMVVACWTLESDYAAHESMFEGILDSFRFDPGKEYQVVEWFDNPVLAWVVIGVAGMVIVLVLRRR